MAPRSRKVLEDALAVEVVPHYREQLEIRLDYLATFETIFLTGQVEQDFHPWGQIPSPGSPGSTGPIAGTPHRRMAEENLTGLNELPRSL